MRHCAASITSSDGAAKGAGVCDQVKKAADGKAEYCSVCDTDGCNSAPAVRSFGLVLAAPLVALFYKLA